MMSILKALVRDSDMYIMILEECIPLCQKGKKGERRSKHLLGQILCTNQTMCSK